MSFRLHSCTMSFFDGRENVYIIGRKDSYTPISLSFIPVLVNLTYQVNCVSFSKWQLPENNVLVNKLSIKLNQNKKKKVQNLQKLKNGRWSEFFATSYVTSCTYPPLLSYFSKETCIIGETLK